MLCSLPLGRAGEGLTAQNKKIDSLLTLIKKDKEDTNKINHLNTLAWAFKGNKPDTGILLSQQAFVLAEKISSSGTGNILISSQNGMANALGQLGTFYYLKSEYSKALEYYMKAVEKDEETKNTNNKAKHLGNIGLVYQDRGDFNKALDYLFKAMKTFEEMGDKNRVTSALCNIGNVYKDQNDYSKALRYYLESLKIAEEIGNKQIQANCLGNIGNIYYLQEEFSKGLEYYFKALEIGEELGDKNKITLALGNIGNIYKSKKENQKALEYYVKSLKIREELGAKNLIGTSLGNIGALYAVMAENQSSQELKVKNFKEAFTYLSRALATDCEIGVMNGMKEDYELLSSLYETSNTPLPDTIGGKLLNMEQMRLRALDYHKKYISIRDTLFSEENKKQLVRKEMNFEFEKKEAEAKAEQDKKNAIQEADAKKQKVIMFSVVGCLLLVICFAGFIFRSLRKTRRQKLIIEHQKHIVDEKQKEILDSIRYAKRIQTALITSEKYIFKNLNRLTEK